jgi:hypothetical protein
MFSNANAVHLSKDQRGKNLAPSRKARKVKELETLGAFAPLRETSYLNSMFRNAVQLSRGSERSVRG